MPDGPGPWDALERPASRNDVTGSKEATSERWASRNDVTRRAACRTERAAFRLWRRRAKVGARR